MKLETLVSLDYSVLQKWHTVSKYYTLTSF